MISCASGGGDETTGADVQTTEPQDGTTTVGATDETSQPQDETTTSGATDETTEADSTTSQPPENNSPFGISMSDLNDMMQPIFSGDTVKNETIMFIEKGEVKKLLFPIYSVISVTSYDGKKVYKEGVDYSITNGKIKVLENSSIPCITTAKYYDCPGSKLNTLYNGVSTPTYWGENKMDEWQVNVNYTHSKKWSGFEQDCQADIFENFIKKLQNGENVTVFFYGDSITNGANASFYANIEPYQHSYPMLFTEALADLFGYTVKYVEVNERLNGTARVPGSKYVGGTNGTITYVNTAVGGWNTKNGADNVKTYVNNLVKTYGCDLLVLAYGMNDGTNAPSFTSNNLKAIVDSVLTDAPNTSVALITTMVNNPADTGRSATAKANQRGAIEDLAEKYVKAGIPCGVCDMGSLSLAVLKRKDFHDYSGNNINHPNDFFGRVYAQTLLQTVIGYENMG